MKKEGAKIMKNMIETKNLTKTYKAFTAVDHVSLHIKKGSITDFSVQMVQENLQL